MDRLDFSNWLKTKRAEKGMTRKQIAEAADITVVAVGRYETGTRTPNVKTALAIAQALGEDNLNIDEFKVRE